MPHTYHTQQQNFIDHLRFQKRYSQHTIISYTNDLQTFGAFMQNQYPDVALDKIKPTFIRSWLVTLKENELVAKTLNRKISTLRSFFNYLLQKEIVNANPVTGIIAQKVPKRLPQFVAEKDTDLLFNEIAFSPGFKGLTEKLVLMMLYHTGLRKAELISLKTTSIDKINSQIKVQGKGGKERLIPINKSLVIDLVYYQTEKLRLLPPTETNTFFVTEKGKPLDPKQVYNIANKYLSKVTTISKKSPHILRHSFATHLMNNGADLNAVKELLGHSSLAATQIYTHNTIEKLKDVYKKAHPKA